MLSTNKLEECSGRLVLFELLLRFPAVAVPTWRPAVLLGGLMARNSFCGCSDRTASQRPVLPTATPLYLRELKRKTSELTRGWKPQRTFFFALPMLCNPKIGSGPTMCCSPHNEPWFVTHQQGTHTSKTLWGGGTDPELAQVSSPLNSGASWLTPLHLNTWLWLQRWGRSVFQILGLTDGYINPFCTLESYHHFELKQRK